jgi:hypothetical protein
LKKAEDERELQKTKQKEIERLQEEIKQLVKLKERLNKKVQKHNKFNTYLEKVCFRVLVKTCFYFKLSL